MEDVSVHAMEGKETFDTKFGFDEHSSLHESGDLAFEGFTDVVHHVFCRLKIIDFTFDVGASGFTD